MAHLVGGRGNEDWDGTLHPLHSWPCCLFQIHNLTVRDYFGDNRLNVITGFKPEEDNQTFNSTTELLIQMHGGLWSICYDLTGNSFTVTWAFRWFKSPYFWDRIKQSKLLYIVNIDVNDYNGGLTWCKHQFY